VVAALGLAWVQVRPNLGDHSAGAPQGASVAPVARCAWFSAAHAAAPSFHPGPRGAASLGGLSPADPSSPALPISPGRAGPRPMPWTWSGQTPRGTGPQKYPALVAVPLVTTGRSPREVPSICALARVTYEGKDNAGHKFWVARCGRYAIRIDATRPGSTTGSSAWRAVRSARVSSPTVTRLLVR
jgi:hypothetical protein